MWSLLGGIGAVFERGVGVCINVGLIVEIGIVQIGITVGITSDEAVEAGHEDFAQQAKDLLLVGRWFVAVELAFLALFLRGADRLTQLGAVKGRSLSADRIDFVVATVEQAGPPALGELEGFRGNRAFDGQGLKGFGDRLSIKGAHDLADQLNLTTVTTKSLLVADALGFLDSDQQVVGHRHTNELTRLEVDEGLAEVFELQRPRLFGTAAFAFGRLILKSAIFVDVDRVEVGFGGLIRGETFGASFPGHRCAVSVFVAAVIDCDDPFARPSALAGGAAGVRLVRRRAITEGVPMSSITFRGSPVNTVGTLPKSGTVAPDFTLVATDLSEANLASFAGKKKVLNIFPSLDTGTCASSVRQFHKKLAEKGGVVVVNVSADLPFAHARFCTAEGIEGVANLSNFRSPEFGTTWAVTMADGPLKGLLSRAVVVLDEHNKVLHAEQVSEIGSEPNYDAALKAIG